MTVGCIAEQEQVIDHWQAEEDRTWDTFQVPQAAYHAAVDGAHPDMTSAELDTLLQAAVKMGRAAERVIAARYRAKEAREGWLELVEGTTEDYEERLIELSVYGENG